MDEWRIEVRRTDTSVLGFERDSQMSGRHLSLLVHFVWSTAAREPWISNEWQDRLYGYLGGILERKNAKLLCAGGMSDHIHLYTSLPSTLSLADIVNAMKANSSGWIHDTFPNHQAFAWQKGYGAFSVSSLLSLK